MNFVQSKGRSSLPNFVGEALSISGEVFLSALSDVMDVLGNKFPFAYYDGDDLRQEGYIWASKVLHKFDSTLGSLHSFLYTCIRRKILNEKRKIVERKTPPCFSCKLKGWCKETKSCLIFNDKMECDLYNSWIVRNAAKKSLSSPEYIVEEVEAKEQRAPEESERLRQALFKVAEKLTLKSKRTLLSSIQNEKIKNSDYERLIKELSELEWEDNKLLNQLKEFL